MKYVALCLSGCYLVFSPSVKLWSLLFEYVVCFVGIGCGTTNA